MRAARFSAPLLAAATLILLAANAWPTIQRKHLLIRERQRLSDHLASERARGDQLSAEIDALQNDPFVIERVYVETWRKDPAGTERFEPERDDDAILD